MTAAVLAGVARRFVPPTRNAALEVAEAFTARGLQVTLEFLPDRRRGSLAALRAELLAVVGEVERRSLAPRVAVTVPLLSSGDAGIDVVRDVTSAAAAAGVSDTVDPRAADPLEVLARLGRDLPPPGVVLRTALRRTGSDLRLLSDTSTRITLAGGAPSRVDTGLFATRGQVDTAYVQGLRRLLAAPGRPVLATHDARLVGIARHLAKEYGRRPGDHEFQLPYGVRPDLQRRLAEAGETVRVHVAYGPDARGHVNRLARESADLSSLVRSLLSRS